MPTYAYKCESCGHGADEWLKMSEANAERVCPACGKPTYRKQITAAAFHLKGGGWYVSDFRDNKKPEPAATPATGCACPGAQSCPAVQAANAASSDSAPSGN